MIFIPYPKITTLLSDRNLFANPTGSASQLCFLLTVSGSQSLAEFFTNWTNTISSIELTYLLLLQERPQSALLGEWC